MSESQRPLAVLVGVQTFGVTDVEHQSTLAELRRLVETLGYETLAVISQKRSKQATGTVVGPGKLKEIARYTGGTGVVKTYEAPKQKRERKTEDDEDEEDFTALLAPPDEAEEGDEDGDLPPEPKRKAEMVIFDDELTPTQLRNIESAVECEVLDRSGVIVEIFHRHAKTREARLQVEIARLRYLAPRLRMTRKRSERSGGGIGAKGAGETAHELDKRRIRDRIAEITRMLEDVHAGQEQRRSRRRDQNKVALVGYTNAGKSSLMRALTGSDVLVQDKLFATLDTTIRAMYPETPPRVLVSDTVGFIKKLPHDLVASFRSTLDEAADASLLLFVVDASDPTFRSQLDVTHEVLAEIGVEGTDSCLVLNKIDRVDAAGRAALRAEYPAAIQLSAIDKGDVARLREHILSFFEKDMVDVELTVPYTMGQLAGEIRRSMRVLGESHDEIGTVFKLRALPQELEKLRERLRSS
jgi:GTP-binding protein HflX